MVVRIEQGKDKRLPSDLRFYPVQFCRPGTAQKGRVSGGDIGRAEIPFQTDDRKGISDFDGGKAAFSNMNAIRMRESLFYRTRKARGGPSGHLDERGD